jgi:hypothetical protein
MLAAIKAGDDADRLAGVRGVPPGHVPGPGPGTWPFWQEGAVLQPHGGRDAAGLVVAL